MKPPIVAAATIRAMKLIFTRAAPGAVAILPTPLDYVPAGEAGFFSESRRCDRRTDGLRVEREQTACFRLLCQLRSTQSLARRGRVGGAEVRPAECDLGDIRDR